jgi:cytochrome c-type biogenesis protein CcmE
VSSSPSRVITQTSLAPGPPGIPNSGGIDHPVGTSPGPTVHNPRLVDPSRKRRVRLVVALTAAVLLAGALIYTSFSSATEAKQPSQVVGHMDQGQSLQLTGKVVNGSVQRNGDTLRFRIADRNGSGPSLPVVYTGEVPDPFRQGREVIVSGSIQDGTFIGKRDSLITKCPSKFQTKSTSPV